MDKEIIWTAPEFEFSPKSVGWYWLSIIVAALTFLFALWQKNILFALFVIIAEFMILHWARQHPRHLQFRLTPKGLFIGEHNFHAFEHLMGFFILEIEGEERNELILRNDTKINPYIKVLIFRKDIPTFKQFLSRYLKEIEYTPTLSDGLSKFLGF